MDLRRAAQAVRILHAGIDHRGAMRFANFAAAIEASRLRAVMAGLDKDGRWRCAVECGGTAAQRVERKRGGDIGGVDGDFRFAQRQAREARAWPACR